MSHGSAAVVRPPRADGHSEPEPSTRRRSEPSAQVESSPTCTYTSRQFQTRLPPEECRRCLEAHVLPTERRFALQLRWRPPPAEREVTGGSRWVIVAGPSPRSWSFIHRLGDRLWVWLTLAVVAAASIVEGWRAAEHEAFLLGFLADVLEAEEVS